MLTSAAADEDEDAVGMRTADILIGQTYAVVVPRRLPPFRTIDPSAWPEWMQLSILRGGRFRLTAVEVDPAARPPTVEGLRVVTNPMIRIDLTVEQAAALGLPPGAYWLQGVLHTVGGGVVQLPDVQTIVVPTRWLRALDDPRPALSHWDADRPI